jgi:hypothetical protein
VTITAVNVSIDGATAGSAAYGSSRTGVCVSGTGPGCPNVGWQYPLNTASLLNGQHTFRIDAVTNDPTPRHVVLTQRFIVLNNGSSAGAKTTSKEYIFLNGRAVVVENPR